MKNGYKIVWTEHALADLGQTFSYLEQNFSEHEIRRLAHKIESILALIATQPTMYPESSPRKGVRRAVILRLNSLYYRVTDRQIEILSFFSNRQDPEKSRF